MLNLVDEARGWPGGFNILFIFHVSRLRTRILEVVKGIMHGLVAGWTDGWMDDLFVHSEATLRDEERNQTGRRILNFVYEARGWMTHRSACLADLTFCSSATPVGPWKW